MESAPLSAGPEAEPFFPKTAPDFGCHRHKRASAATLAKVSDQQIMTWVDEACGAIGEPSSYAAPRSQIIRWLTSEMGMNPTPAYARLETVHDRGLIGMGMNLPKEWSPQPNVEFIKDRVWIWPIKGASIPTPVDERMLAALANGPMSLRFLAKQCDCSLGSVHAAAVRLMDAGRITRSNRGLELVPEKPTEV